MVTKMCPKFLASAIFYHGKWPTSVTINRISQSVLNLFSKFKLIVKFIVVFYEIIKIQPGKTKFSTKFLTSKMLKVQILAI